MDTNTDNEFGGPIKPIKVNQLDGLFEFLCTIDWTEAWFSGLAIFHVTCAILTIFTRKTGVLQSIYFAVLMIMVFCAEYINEWAARNWNLFASQQYFDSNGLFISIVFSMPLLFNCLVIVVSWLWDVGMLISNVKQIKMRQRGRKVESKINEEENTDPIDSIKSEEKKEK